MHETSQTMSDAGGLDCLGPYIPPPGDQDDLWRDYAAEALAGHAGRAANFPDFMLIGGSRSGTTWLYEALARHPNMFTGGRKRVSPFQRQLDRRKPRKLYGFVQRLGRHGQGRSDPRLWIAAEARH